ncbi:hypothetical protein TNCV_1832571 [Trichonephila clavipes]|nr:hypothetical protein TNCV_1832571 [Trichonephila clavipes]
MGTCKLPNPGQLYPIHFGLPRFLWGLLFILLSNVSNPKQQPSSINESGAMHHGRIRKHSPFYPQSSLSKEGTKNRPAFRPGILPGRRVNGYKADSSRHIAGIFRPCKRGLRGEGEISKANRYTLEETCKSRAMKLVYVLKL